MKPIWDQVKLATINSGIIYREIDEDKTHTPGITGYPTILMLSESGHTYLYTGPANFNRLRNWIIGPDRR